MSNDCTLDDVRSIAAGLSSWAHLATVGADGEPDVVPALFDGQLELLGQDRPEIHDDLGAICGE